MPPIEKEAIRSLEQRDDIIIKPADKGSAVVVLNKCDYIKEAERQLSDEKFYKKLDSDPTTEFSKKISKDLETMCKKGHLDQTTVEYLKPENPKAGRFYLLPKIHKANNPGRPIVSANGTPTEKISEFVDFHLRPHVENLPSYIKDTTHYLKEMESMNPPPPDTILVSMDVTSLYTNIPHDDGIEACKEVWDTRITLIPPTECLVQLLTLVLKCNNFIFNDIHYLQVNGTAMGTKMAPSYANIFMGKLEKHILATALHNPFSWFRFIDDIDMKWVLSQKELDDFIVHANNAHPSIKFTHEISTSKITFLDTTTSIKDGRMITDLYCKPTDKHQYLSPQSCHPRHCTRSIPYSQALRIRRICSSTETVTKRLQELRGHLVNRGYKKENIDEGFTRAENFSREELLTYREKKCNKRVPFVLTYHPAFNQLSQIIRENWKEIEKHPKLSIIFPEPPILAFRKPKSLKDRLVRAELTSSSSSSPTGSCKPCGNKRCMTCIQILTSQTFCSQATDSVYTIFCNVNCKTKNSIYLLQCKCGKQYVGESKQEFHKRLNGHRSDLRCKPDLPLSRHLRSPGHSEDDFKRLTITIIDHNITWSGEERVARERFWIRKLKTLAPNGINEKV